MPCLRSTLSLRKSPVRFAVEQAPKRKGPWGPLSWMRALAELAKPGVGSASSSRADLVRWFEDEGIAVVEVNRQTGRRRGEPEIVHAEVAARATLNSEADRGAKSRPPWRSR